MRDARPDDRDLAPPVEPSYDLDCDEPRTPTYPRELAEHRIRTTSASVRTRDPHDPDAHESAVRRALVERYGAAEAARIIAAADRPSHVRDEGRCVHGLEYCAPCDQAEADHHAESDGRRGVPR